MKIIGEDREIELTQAEWFKAYVEMERNHDIQNIKNKMPEYLDSDVYERLKGKPAFIEDAAVFLIIYLRERGMAYEFAIREAIKDTAKKYIEPQER